MMYTWMQEKVDALVEEKNKEGLVLREGAFLHTQSKGGIGDGFFIFFRPVDNSFIVWTTYMNGEEKTSLNSFFNGKYDMTEEEAIVELKRRVAKVLEG